MSMMLPLPLTISPDSASNTLALELVARLEPASSVLARYGITPEEAERLLATPTFKAQLREAHQFWNSPENREERIRIKAAMMSEDALPEMHMLLHDGEKPMTARVDLFKTINRLAGLDKTAEGAVGTGGFRIVMNFGFEDRPQVLEGRAIDVDSQ